MSLARRLALLLLAITLAAAAVATHREALARRAGFPPETDLAYLPRTSVLRAAALGHSELAADLVFIRTITYFGTKFTGDKAYDWLPSHLETILELDPWFLGAYRFAGLATMYNGVAITNRAVRDSIRFLELGLSRFPSDWEMAFMVGCNYLFELKTEDAAEKERWRHQGAAWIRRAAAAGGPGWLPGLAATIMTQEGESEAAIRYLEEAYLTAPTERAREEVAKQLATRRRSSLATLTRARDAFNAGWNRWLPYAPADLYVLMGEPRSPRLDWRFLLQSDPVERALAAGDEGREQAGPAAPGQRVPDGGTAAIPDAGR